MEHDLRKKMTKKNSPLIVIFYWEIDKPINQKNNTVDKNHAMLAEETGMEQWFLVDNIGIDWF